MRELALALVIGSLGLNGCARHYVMRLSNGQEIVTATKPKSKDGCYYFKDARGGEHVISRARVTEMEPASMSRQEHKAVAPRQPQPAKHRHWYLLWLG